MRGGWRVIDVWRSRAAFNRFGKKLKPVLKEVGIQQPRLQIFPLPDSSNPSFCQFGRVQRALNKVDWNIR
jgi:hypothetical protein